MENHKREFPQDPEEIHERYRELDELKNTFIALVSHELRTPVNLISGYLELGIEELDGNPKEARNYFVKADESIQRLRRVVEELTDFANLQRGKPITYSDPMRIESAFQETYHLLRPELEKKQINLHVDISRAIREISYDGSSLMILFRNILSNAAKFSPVGSRVCINGRQIRDHLFIAFHDYSKPIPPEKKESIFEDFRQLENYLTRRYEGMGLGLAVARRTARLLGGDITLKIREDGNTFKIKLPLKSEGKRTIT
jgi:signal transduction histidine kinase